MADKKPMSEERRKALEKQLAKGRATAAANRAAKVGPVQYEELPKEPEQDLKSNISDEDLASLLKRIAELEQRPQYGPVQPAPAMPGGVSVGPRGMIGTFEKYLIDPKNYPDPTSRLAREPRLARFAFDINYELSWDVGISQYETKDGINTREPKFTLELIKVVLDEETGERTTGRYVIRTAVFHEDPQAALTIARERNLPVDETNEKVFLDEMRYLRMRDWLLEAFYPPRSTARAAKKDMVVGNRVVQFYEASSEESQSIPFDELNGKF